MERCKSLKKALKDLYTAAVIQKCSAKDANVRKALKDLFIAAVIQKCSVKKVFLKFSRNF